MSFLATHAPELALTGSLLVCAGVFVGACGMGCNRRDDDR